MISNRLILRDFGPVHVAFSPWPPLKLDLQVDYPVQLPGAAHDLLTKAARFQ